MKASRLNNLYRNRLNNLWRYNKKNLLLKILSHNNSTSLQKEAENIGLVYLVNGLKV